MRVGSVEPGEKFCFVDAFKQQAGELWKEELGALGSVILGPQNAPPKPHLACYVLKVMVCRVLALPGVTSQCPAVARWAETPVSPSRRAPGWPSKACGLAQLPSLLLSKQLGT